MSSIRWLNQRAGMCALARFQQSLLLPAFPSSPAVHQTVGERTSNCFDLYEWVPVRVNVSPTNFIGHLYVFLCKLPDPDHFFFIELSLFIDLKNNSIYYGYLLFLIYLPHFTFNLFRKKNRIVIKSYHVLAWQLGASFSSLSCSFLIYKMWWQLSLTHGIVEREFT